MHCSLDAVGRLCATFYIAAGRTAREGVHSRLQNLNPHIDEISEAFAAPTGKLKTFRFCTIRDNSSIEEFSHSKFDFIFCTNTDSSFA
jgi:hypothetical protein